MTSCICHVHRGIDRHIQGFGQAVSLQVVQYFMYSFLLRKLILVRTCGKHSESQEADLHHVLQTYEDFDVFVETRATFCICL